VGAPPAILAGGPARKDLRPCTPTGLIRDGGAVNVDSAGLEALSPHDCLALARTMPIGRIVFTDQALPAVQPVNFLLADGCVVFRTGEGTKLAAALRDTVVAFEIDDYDTRTESGWSVTVVGRAEPVIDAAESARLARLPLRTWAPGNRDRFVRIRPEYISGRRLLVDGGPNGAADRAGDEAGGATGADERPDSTSIKMV
jgi:uncharacterized protein